VTLGDGEYRVSNRRVAGTLTGGNSLAINSQSAGTVFYEVDAGLGGGAAVGFQATLDDTNWFSIKGVDLDGLLISSLPAAGLPQRGRLLLSGFSQVRLLLVGGSGSSEARLAVSFPPGLVSIGGLQVVDDAAFTAAISAVVPIGARYDSAGDTVNDGDAGIPRMSANRNLLINIRDAAGNERGANVNASNELAVAVGASIPGTGATNLGKAEDAHHTSGDVGVMALSVRQDTAAALADTDDDYQPLITDASGRLHVAVGSVPAPLDVSGAGTEAAALRVTIASDSTGVVRLTDGTDLAQITAGGELNVAEANSAAIKTAAESLDGKVTACDTGAVVVSGFPDNEPFDMAQVAGTAASVDEGAADAGTQRVILPSTEVSAVNSTTTPLGISAVFTGTGVDVLGYSAVTVSVYANEISATSGLRLEFSSDDTNWDVSHPYDYPGAFQFNVGETTHPAKVTVPVEARYFRVKYTNGTTGQGTFRLSTILHRGSVPPMAPVLLHSQMGPTTSTFNLAAPPVAALLIGQRKDTNLWDPIRTSDDGSALGAVHIVPVSDSSGNVLANDLGVEVQQAAAADLNATVVQGTASNLKTEAVGPAAQDAAASGNPVQVAHRSAVTGTMPSAVSAAGYVVAPTCDCHGTAHVIGGAPETQRSYDVYTSAQTPATIDTPAAGKRFIITAYLIRVSQDVDKDQVSYKLTMGSTDVAGSEGDPPGGGQGEGCGSGKLWEGAADEAIKFTCSDPRTTTGTVTVAVTYYEVDR